MNEVTKDHLSLLVLVGSISGVVLCLQFLITYNPVATLWTGILGVSLLVAHGVLLTQVSDEARRVKGIRWVLMSGLALAVSLSPEIPTDIFLAGGRSLAIQMEDVYLATLLLGWFVVVWRFHDTYLHHLVAKS